MKIGRADNSHGIKAAFRDHLLTTLEPGERLHCRQLELPGRLPHGVAKIFGHADNLVAAVLGEEAGDPLPAMAATDEAETNPAAGRAALGDGKLSGGKRCETWSGLLEKLAPGNIGCIRSFHMRGGQRKNSIVEQPGYAPPAGGAGSSSRPEP